MPCPFGDVACLPFDIVHDVQGLASLAGQLKVLNSETRVIMEHTEHHYEAVAKSLHKASLYVDAENPLLIKKYGCYSLRRVKTDKADTMKIARYAFNNWAGLRDYIPMPRFVMNRKP